MLYLDAVKQSDYDKRDYTFDFQFNMFVASNYEEKEKQEL